MDTPTPAAPDEKTPPQEETLATQPSKEKPAPSSPLEVSAERFNTSVARLTVNTRASGGHTAAAKLMLRAGGAKRYPSTNAAKYPHHA